jgi:tetratricopeptide (TPR) repeat protein
MAALIADAVWIQEAWRVRSIALSSTQIQVSGTDLVFAPAGEPSREKLVLTFASDAVARRWHDRVQACQSNPVPACSADERLCPEGVALVQQAPEVPHVVLGRVDFSHSSAACADRGIQLRAAMRGADAIVELRRERRPEMGLGARQVSGLAIRAADADARERLRWKWYAEEVSALSGRMLILLGITAVLIFVGIAYLTGKSNMLPATGETRSESVTSAALVAGLFFAWPLFVTLLLRVLRLRELIVVAGLAVLVATTGRGLVMVLSHLTAVFTTGASLFGSTTFLILDPFEWAVIVIGAVQCTRAWRLARDSIEILPVEARTVSVRHRFWSRGLLATTAVYSVFLLGWAAASRYELSSYLLQEGVDPRREHEALLALNEGAKLLNNGELEAGERSLQRALELWEVLTARRRAPSSYRVNLAITLNNLAVTRLRQDRGGEAEAYYARAVALADQLDGDPQFDPDARKLLAGARQVLADLRAGKSVAVLDEKDAQAVRKYEDAEVIEQKEPQKAEALFREAIAAWEEILPQATSKEYRKSAVARLARAYIRLGELQVGLGKRTDWEASLKKSIDYGSQAVDLDPGRPVVKHNLDVARRRLDQLHDQTFQEEIDKLGRAERYADAIALFKRGITEHDQRLRAGTDLDTVIPSLAYRLERFAWLLAHCPDKRLRDTKASVEHARRATSLRPDIGEYWYTLAMVQYRNGDWRDSLASLDTVKVKEGELDASSLLLSGMNLHRLDRKEEARTAVKKAVEWMDERSRNSQKDALLKMEYEFMRPAVEALLKEALSLMNGQESGGPKEA